MIPSVEDESYVIVDEDEAPPILELERPFEEFVREQDLNFEEFEVTTEDGYILKVHHVFSQAVQEWNEAYPNNRAPVVFI